MVIDKLTVFNAMIATMGMMPYPDLASAQSNPYYAQAMAIVSRESRRFQTRGWWFNTTYFDAEAGNVTFPCAILRIQGPDIAGLVIRGNDIYNLRDKEMLSQNVSNVKAVVELAFEDLPPIAQDYAMAKSILSFQGEYDSTQSTAARWKEQAAESWILMATEDIKAKRANRLLSPTVLHNIVRASGRFGQRSRIA